MERVFFFAWQSFLLLYKRKEMRWLGECYCVSSSPIDQTPFAYFQVHIIKWWLFDTVAMRKSVKKVLKDPILLRCSYINKKNKRKNWINDRMPLYELMWLWLCMTDFVINFMTIRRFHQFFVLFLLLVVISWPYGAENPFCLFSFFIPNAKHKIFKRKKNCS